MNAWRESASLILAARHTKRYIRSSSTKYNYNLLCMKRHQNSKFMPNAYVFPGGVTSPSDADLKWHNLYSAFGFDTNSFTSLRPNTSNRPQIFKFKPNELPKEISLRITAIRETFEECGILLCKQSREDKREDFGWAQYMNNLWSLYEWSNWLTPTFFSERYDTAFYLACVSTVPQTICEVKEMEDLKWDMPGNYLFSSPDVTLPLPQQYEIARIAKFESIHNLLDFAIDRSKIGVLLNLPVKIELQDGKVLVLPGDSITDGHLAPLQLKNVSIAVTHENSKL
ncbi:Nucleoside diphosphate-linked moiety X motif 19, mitochondrial [Melipona quadrifasciata]|uniref:Nucleoside diphosphate-linked moiety X motif 19, mitochondrial n=1 Tax=Melipona quadrifasciata TaxID=166423 RepID=A0A0M8ZTQ0_9HYME|nr:Nucleoside diphosphate-linked moiety X motif 19, mitochondrial [Melipona quadrifasciata]